jgi:hypothetical protein
MFSTLSWESGFGAKIEPLGRGLRPRWDSNPRSSIRADRVILGNGERTAGEKLLKKGSKIRFLWNSGVGSVLGIVA